MRHHMQDKQRHSQDGADPEAPPHVAPFGVRPFLRGSDTRLQSHAALGTAARMIADNLRIHWADVLDFGSGGRDRSGGRLLPATSLRGRTPLAPKIAVRLGPELLRTMGATKVVFLPLILDRGRRRSWVHRHATHGIDDSGAGYEGKRKAMSLRTREMLFMIHDAGSGQMPGRNQKCLCVHFRGASPCRNNRHLKYAQLQEYRPV